MDRLTDTPIRHSIYIAATELDPQPGGYIRFVWRKWEPERITATSPPAGNLQCT